VVSLVEDAVGKGAKVILGGEKHDFGDLYYKPTILTDLSGDMVAARDRSYESPFRP
jgi:succinate-semialdehyde dehydrogenase/glutarate-semialdehyde dehydrogenase